MRKRHPLKNVIIKAWQGCIDNDYKRQRINSERSLQASFWAQLNNILQPSRRLFIEPPLSIETRYGIRKVIPDIVICNTKEVIAIIELKYLPKGEPNFKKDIESLALISKYRKQLIITNSRFRGAEKDSIEYTFSKNILFVWACIHARPKQGIDKPYSSGHRPLKDEYFQLHAETRFDNEPLIYTIE